MDIHQVRVNALLQLQAKRFSNRQADLARAIHRSSSQINQWISGVRRIREDSARMIEEKLALPRGWMDRPHEPGLSSSEAVAIAAESPGTAPVPVLDVRVSAGAGVIRPEDDPIVGSMRLNTLWVRRHLPMITSITNLVTVIAHGRSMEPTFCDGSILLVDQSVTEIRVDGIYVLSFNDELYVKRVTRRLPDGGLLVSSDNPLHQGFTIENGSRESVQVLGRVVWAFDSKGV